MTYPAAFKLYISNKFRFCLDVIDHREYKLSFHYAKEPCSTDSSTDSDRVTSASVRMDTVYLWAFITIYPSMLTDWKKRDYEDLADSILHETCHLLTEPICELFMGDVSPSQQMRALKVIERQTQRIRNTISTRLPKGWYLP